MALPRVKVGDPHAAAHNDERDVINDMRIMMDQQQTAISALASGSAGPGTQDIDQTTSNNIRSSTSATRSALTDTVDAMGYARSSSVDSLVAGSLRDGSSSSRSALGDAVRGMGYLPTTDLDHSVAGKVKVSSETRTAISELIAASLPSNSGSTSGSSGTTTSANKPYFYVEDYRQSGMSDDAAVRACIKAAASQSETYENPVVVFAARVYSVTHAVFSDIGVVIQFGMTFVGQGYTTLKLIAGGKSDQWFYDNGSSQGSAGNDAKDNRRLGFAMWMGIRFTSDDPNRANGNGFRFTGIGFGNEQNFTFIHCMFEKLNFPFATAGTLNTDSIRLYACYGSDNNSIIYINNNQCLEIEWHGTSFELTRKDGIVVGPQGGGDVKLLGGSYILEKVSGDSNTYALCRVTATDNSAWGNGNFTFDGIRTELRDADTMILDAPGVAGAGYFSYLNCNMFVASANKHAMVRIGTNRRVSFSRCQLPPGAYYDIDTGYEGMSLPPAMYSFVECEVPADFAASFRWKNVKLGTVHAERCREIGNRGDYGGGQNKVYINDFDMNVLAGGVRSPGMNRKIVPIFASNMYAWPCGPAAGAVADWSVIMPPGALITKISIYRPASGSSSTAYQLAVTNGDKSTTYLSSNASGTFGASVNMEYVSPIQITSDASDIKNRTVMMYAPKTGDAAGVFGGYAFIEYL